MRCYKGTDKDMKCRGLQYEIGKTIEEDEADLCKKGLHACTDPIDVFAHYEPSNGSRYFLAEAEDVSDQMESDSKIVAKKMTLKEEIGIAGIAKAQIEHVMAENGFDEQIKRAKESAENHATGERGAASATGWSGAASATGERGAASATGWRGAASATGDSGEASAGHKTGIAVAWGDMGKAKGVIGAHIVCAEWAYGDLVCAKMAVVDGVNIKPDVYYTLQNGEFVEAN